MTPTTTTIQRYRQERVVLSSNKSNGFRTRDQTWRAGLLSWVRGCFNEGFAEASKSGQPILFIREKEIKCEIPLEIFDSEIEDVRFFAREEGPIVLGIGIAREWELDSEESFRDLKSTLDLIRGPPLPTIWLLGGWSFPPGRDAKSGNGLWRAFPRSSWVIPAVSFISSKGRKKLVLAAYLHGSTPQNRIKKYYERLIATVPPIPRRLPHSNQLKNQPSRKTWESLTRRALESISEAKMNKVVIARTLRIRFDADIPSSIVLKRLHESNPDSTVFAIRKGNATFLGATPESLLSLKDREAKVDCLAATTVRSSDTATDELLGLNLLQDMKSMREHQIVVKGVTDSLSPMCSKVEVQKETRLKKLAAVQHLLTTVKGRLLPGVHIWSAGLSLWPTPATGGEPKAAAVHWIQDFEPVMRGWYSGVVGCVNASGDGDLVVAIRSGIIQGKSAAIFAGSGIVSGSCPDKEFEETRWKMRTMREALGVPERNE